VQDKETAESHEDSGASFRGKVTCQTRDPYSHKSKIIDCMKAPFTNKQKQPIMGAQVSVTNDPRPTSRRARRPVSKSRRVTITCATASLFSPYGNHGTASDDLQAPCSSSPLSPSSEAHKYAWVRASTRRYEYPLTNRLTASSPRASFVNG
jgi:hypothetical protein